MNIVYYIYRKVVRWEGEFFYIFCFANTKKKRGLISYVLGLQTLLFSLLENTTESV